MARLARLTLGGYPHLVRLRTGTRPLLHDDIDAGRLLADLRVAAGAAQVAIHGYALLPEALWLLATPEDAGGLGRLLQALGRTYVRAYNQRHGGRGALFDGLSSSRERRSSPRCITSKRSRCSPAAPLRRRTIRGRATAITRGWGSIPPCGCTPSCGRCLGTRRSSGRQRIA